MPILFSAAFKWNACLWLTGYLLFFLVSYQNYISRYLVCCDQKHSNATLLHSREHKMLLLKFNTTVSQHKLSSSYLISNYHLSNPLQYSCLENPVVREAWWATVHGVAQSWTRLKRLSVHACIGEGNGNPLQYSCLENPMDRGAWWAAIYGVAESQTLLKRLSSSSSSMYLM